MSIIACGKTIGNILNVNSLQNEVILNFHVYCLSRYCEGQKLKVTFKFKQHFRENCLQSNVGHTGRVAEGMKSGDIISIFISINFNLSVQESYVRQIVLHKSFVGARSWRA